MLFLRVDIRECLCRQQRGWWSGPAHREVFDITRKYRVSFR